MIYDNVARPPRDFWSRGGRHDHDTVYLHFSCTFQRAVLTALSGTNDGSCHCQCAVLGDLCGAGVDLCLFLLLNVVYFPINVKLVLVHCMTKQLSDGKEVDIYCIVNLSKIMSTSLRSVDIIFLGLTI